MSDLLMAVFLAFIGKELWEAFVLRRETLSGRQAAMTIGTTAEGVILWQALTRLLQTAEEAAPDMGRYIPAASDVVLGAFWIGKPLGCLAAIIGVGIAFGLRLPQGPGLRDLMLIALLLGMGCTARALMLDPALPGGIVRKAARAGLVARLVAGPAAILCARLVRRG